MQTTCSIKNKKMMMWAIIIALVLMFLLIIRIAVIQFIDGDKLK